MICCSICLKMCRFVKIWCVWVVCWLVMVVVCCSVCLCWLYCICYYCVSDFGVVVLVVLCSVVVINFINFV